MRLRALLFAAAGLAALDAGLARRHGPERTALRDGLIDAPLVDPSVFAAARRVVVREKPQSRVLFSDDNGAEVRVEVSPNAPVRETVLEKDPSGVWLVANCFGLEAEPGWLGQTMRDLGQGRLIRRVTTDPALMDGLGLGAASVRFEDGQGRVLRELQFGRRDGGQAYPFVRIDGGEAFLARDSAELVGDPLAWVPARVLTFEPAEVRDVRISWEGKAPMALTRPARGRPFQIGVVPIPGLEKVLGQLLSTPAMLVVAPDGRAARSAQARPSVRLDWVLFDGRSYSARYGLPGDELKGEKELEGDPPGSFAVAFYSAGDRHDPAARAGSRAAFAYARGATVGRIPADRAALLALP